MVGGRGEPACPTRPSKIIATIGSLRAQKAYFPLILRKTPRYFFTISSALNWVLPISPSYWREMRWDSLICAYEVHCDTHKG